MKITDKGGSGCIHFDEVFAERYNTPEDSKSRSLVLNWELKNYSDELRKINTNT